MQTEQDLLAALAGPSPQAAWSGLVDRFHARVYALACHILRSRSDAEDVAQETFLTVWNKRHQLPPPEYFERWVLRIAANRALVVARSTRRWGAAQARCQGHRRTIQVPSDQPLEGAPTGAGDLETRSALQGAVATLPDEQRVALVLQFFSGFSPDEVAQLCKCHRTTIERRTSQALERLRASLRSSGLAAAWPTAEGGGLGPFLAAGLDLGRLPSHTLCERLLALSGPLGEGPRQNLCAAKAGLAPPVWMTALGLVAAAGIAAGIWMGGAAKETGEAPGGASGLGRPVAPALGSWNWNFRRGPHPDLEVVSGSWAWRREGDGSGSMVAPGPVLVLLPPALSGRPCKVEMLYRPQESSSGEMGASKAEVGPEIMRWSSTRGWRRAMEHPRGPLARFEVFITERHSLALLNGQVCHFGAFEQPGRTSRVVVHILRACVEEIALRELTDAELPLAAREGSLARQGPDDSPMVSLGLELYRKDRHPECFERWLSFEAGLPEALSPRTPAAGGSWRRVPPGPHELGALSVEGQEWFVLSERVPRRPCLVEIRFGPAAHRASRDVWVDCFWTDGERVPALTCFRRRTPLLFKGWGEACSRYLYLADRTIAHFVGEQPDRLYEYQRPYPHQGLAFHVSNARMVSLWIREVPPQERSSPLFGLGSVKSQLRDAVSLPTFLLSDLEARSGPGK